MADSGSISKAVRSDGTAEQVSPDLMLQVVQDLRSLPPSGKIWIFEAVLLLLFWSFQGYRITKVQTWARQIFTQAWVGLVYLLTAAVLLPIFVYGNDFRLILAKIFKTFLKSWLEL